MSGSSVENTPAELAAACDIRSCTQCQNVVDVALRGADRIKRSHAVTCPMKVRCYWTTAHSFFIMSLVPYSCLSFALCTSSSLSCSSVVLLVAAAAVITAVRFSSVLPLSPKQQAVSRVQLRCSNPPQTHSASSPSILHTRSSFHTRHFHYRHPYTRLQHRLGHPSRTNLTYHMT